MYRKPIRLNEHVVLKYTILYRAAEIPETRPRARRCKETNKKGAYFSCDNPYLSQVMPIEKHKDLYLCVYITLKNIRVSCGKFSYTYDKNNKPSHIDYEIGPGELDDDNFKYKYHPHNYSEVF